MSSHIMAYAVQDVVKNKELQQLCKAENGVSRSKIMKWIENVDSRNHQQRTINFMQHGLKKY